MMLFDKAPRCLLATVSVLALSSAAHADFKSKFHLAGHPHALAGLSLANTPVTTSTASATAFLPSCSVAGDGPLYPSPWTWDASKVVGSQPKSASDAMGLTPQIEQWRGGVKIATWSKWGATAGNCASVRETNPGNFDISHGEPCGGPFGRDAGSNNAGARAAWKPGDTFKVHAAVYREMVYTGSNFVKFYTSTVGVGDTTITVDDTSLLAAGYSLKETTDDAHFPKFTHIVNILSSTQFTIDQAVTTAGSVGINYVKPMQNVEFVGIPENVPGYGMVQPAIRYSDSADKTQGASSGLIDFYNDFANRTGADIRGIYWHKIDLIVDKPPPGQLYWLQGTPGKALAFFGGTELQGYSKTVETVRFEDMKVKGSVYMSAPNGWNGIKVGVPTVRRATSGKIVINRVEFDNNGGSDGPAHAIYTDGGTYQLEVTSSWFHNTKYGHNIKSRSLDTVVIGNYLQGNDPIEEAGIGSNWGESHLVNAPCGGRLIMKDNILVKRHGYDASNGVMMRAFEDAKCYYEDTAEVDSTTTYAYPVADALDKEIDIENNTLVAMVKRDGGGPLGNPIVPFNFRYRPVPGSPGLYGFPRPAGYANPGDTLFPSTNVTIRNNVLAGFCPSGVASSDFPAFTDAAAPQGPNLVVGFDDLNQSFGLNQNYVTSGDTAIVGAPAYAHEDQAGGVRALATLGAVDAYAGNVTASVPDVLLVPVPRVLPSGSTTTLKWYTTGATACTASGGTWSGAKAATGTEVVTPPSDADTDYSLTCTGPTGSRTFTTKVQTFAAPQILSFTSTPSPATITSGQSVTFNWTTANADYCSIIMAASDTDIANGSHTYSPAQTQRYALQCNGQGHGPGANGLSDVQTILVQVGATVEKPSVRISADPSTVPSGSTVTLSWDSSGADTCTATAGSDWIAAGGTGGATSGSVVLAPGLAFAAQRTYSVQCSSAGGGTSSTRSVLVVGGS